MKVWCISDTHGKEKELNIPSDIDLIIHAGDLGTFRDPVMNYHAVMNCLDWLQGLAIKYKVIIMGNHDTSVEKGLITKGDMASKGIICLEQSSTTINGIKIFGSPYTPSFSQGWAYNVPRHKLKGYWDKIPKDTDIVVTHGPAKGILDLTVDNNNNYTQCGCKSLRNKLFEVKPRYHIFGHIHTEPDCFNAGIQKITGIDTQFVNVSVLDIAYNKCNNGIILEII